VTALSVGALVEVRDSRWVVSEVDACASSTLVSLQSVADGEYGRTLEVIWEVEPGRRVLPAGSLPDVVEHGFDQPQRLAAFLDAVRWSAVTSADVKTLQAPLRSGVAIEDYQLEPVSRAVGAPRVNLLLADDVGLGKTIEAGLVARELLLRQRARRLMIVCPAGLTLKWRDEMAEKFGLDFAVIDSACCAQVRRDFGSTANPFQVHPLAIVSLPWLRGPKAQRLLDEVLPAGAMPQNRPFDLLILDEAHHVAPAAPKQVYAVDSQQTKLIRRLAPHFTHRLFLSATPHNGYQASFTALLEILDDQRFMRGMEPDRAAVKQTVVRRLKRDVVNPDGTPRFVARQTRPIPVDYPDDEREIHALLTEFTALRRRRVKRMRGRRATDLITILLKKRLFSSPAAFTHTVGVYLETLQRRSGAKGAASDDVPEWMDDFFDEVATYDDEALREAEDDALDRAVPLQVEEDDESGQEIELLRRMERWALAHEAEPDAKARELINYLTAICRPEGKHWTYERVVVFTEYRDTQRWLAGLLRQQGIDEPYLAQLHGGMLAREREQLRLAFQAAPTEHKVRILLATDAASEGIDLQNHCHRLVNFDIPFNPNRLEQRIGRIDRYGQRHAPDIRHFVGSGWEGAVDSYEADLEFLSRVALKVARMEADLGPVNAVLADAVQRRMLGERVEIDVDTEVADVPALPVESDVRRQVVRLREVLDKTVHDLGITPTAVHRVVSTALELARQQPLRPLVDDRHVDERLYEVPPLTGSWERATAGLTEKLEIPDRPPRQHPVTFDADAAHGRDDVVLAHLGHPLVAMSTRLLVGAAENSDVGLHRVTAVVSDDPRLTDVLVGAFSRFVLVGADGVRLHEEVLHAGGWAPEQGRFRRLENLGLLGELLGRALTEGTPASTLVQARLVARWPRMVDGLLGAIDWRANTREQSLERVLGERERDERDRLTEDLARFEASLRGALADDAEDAEDALFSRVEVTKSQEERAQYQRDRRSWSERLAGLTAERDRELAAITARYAGPAAHRFPVAVVFVVPRREAVQ
jgi:superfamily II DNA or RNA helicase